MALVLERPLRADLNTSGHRPCKTKLGGLAHAGFIDRKKSGYLVFLEMPTGGKRHGPFAKAPRRFGATRKQRQLVIPVIPLEASPQGLNRRGWSLDALA